MMIILLACFASAHAADSAKGQARLFAGGLTAKPDEVNTVIQPAGLEEMKTLGAYGMEGSVRVFPGFNLGLRFVGKYGKVKEKATIPVNSANPYYSSVQTQEMLITARISLINTSFFIFDVFGGGGWQQGKLDIRTATGDGYYDASNSASPASSYGASIGFGFASTYLFIEAGQDTSSLSGFTRTGVTTTNIQSVDTGGPFVFVGLCFNGVPGLSKNTSSGGGGKK